MFVIIWKYQVKIEKVKEFETIYAENGTWANLFKKSKGYLGTELLHEETNSKDYLTIDRWNSKGEYEGFLAQYHVEYKVLDANCEGLTEQETLIGKWNLK